MDSDKTVTIARRLRGRLSRSGDCVEFTGTKHNSGYGLIIIGGKQKRVHRVVYEAVYGPIADGLIVCHSCDNRACCNPEHLFLSDHSGNAADRNSKNRQAIGDGHGRAKITDAQVAEIMRDRRKPHIVAAEYGISETYVSRIRSRRSPRAADVAGRLAVRQE